MTSRFILKTPFKLMIAVSMALSIVACSDPRAKHKSASEPEQDPGVYYRMRVGLTYKDKPVDIDFVAGCNVHLGRDLSGGSTEEISSMTDRSRGVRMPEGHAVIINTYPAFESPRFSPCLGDVTGPPSKIQGKTPVPEDWLPFIEWFERDDEFTHGIGYMTQDAYANKNARFGFRYARIEHATRQEFETFRKAGPANLLPPHQTNAMEGRPDPIYYVPSDVPENVRKNPSSGWWHTSGRICKGLIRWRPTEAQRALLRAAWPKDKPEYWTIPGGVTRAHLGAEATKPNEFYANGQILVTLFATPYTSTLRNQQPQIFPVRNSQQVPYLTPQTSPVAAEKAIIGDGEASRGFVFCDVDNRNILEAVTGTKWQPGYSLTVDDTQIVGRPQKRFDGSDLAPFFQRDDYVIGYLQGFRG